MTRKTQQIGEFQRPNYGFSVTWAERVNTKKYVVRRGYGKRRWCPPDGLIVWVVESEHKASGRVHVLYQGAMHQAAVVALRNQVEHLRTLET